MSNENERRNRSEVKDYKSNYLVAFTIHRKDKATPYEEESEYEMASVQGYSTEAEAVDRAGYLAMSPAHFSDIMVFKFDGRVDMHPTRTQKLHWDVVSRDIK